MAVSLDVDLSQSSYDAATNTSTVTATVIVNHTAGSYNGYNPSGTLVVNGQSYDFNSNFNYADGGPISTNGSTVAYTTTITVPHNDDGTADVYASATFDSGVSSGTVVKYAGTVLTGSGSGSSGSGSGSGSGESGSGSGSESGGSGSGSGSGNDPTYNPGPYTISVSKSDAVELLIRKENGEIVLPGSAVPLRTTLCISCKAKEGYRISTFQINNVKYNTDYDIWITISTNTTIVAKALREDESYRVNISKTGDFSLIIQTPDPDIADRYLLLYDGDYVKAGADVLAIFQSGVIAVINGEKLVQPTTAWSGKANQDINIVVSYGTNNNALVNFSQGKNTGLIVRRTDNDTKITDGSLVPVGTEIIIYFSANDGYEPAVCINNEWIDTSLGGCVFVLEENTNIVSAAYVPPAKGLVYIDDGTTFVSYQIFFDNGTSWDQYIPHIDDGVIWHLCN